MVAMKKKGEIFYNFPLPLMNGFWESNYKAQQCLSDILYYYARWIWDKDGSEVPDDDFKSFIEKKLCINNFKFDKKTQLYNRTKDYYWNYSKERYDGAYFSISVDLFFKFYKKETTQEDRIGLLAYLSVKSIIGVRPFAQTNRYMIASRMACNNKYTENLPEEIGKAITRRKFDKMKATLHDIYHVAVYTDRRMRGCYVSLKKDENGEPDMKWLAKEAAKNFASHKESAYKKALEKAREIALNFDDT